MGNEHGKAGSSVTPAGIQSMDESLQKKFSKGIQFNMKIVLKGDRNTGKTCLYNRMGGQGFQEAYIPTNEIQVTSILWSYKVTSDTVKVEVWDVVDKGRVPKKENKGILKIFNTTTPEEEEEEGAKGEKVLDATFLNVYKGCHGVVLMFDMTKIWTWKYVERELPKVPYDIPVIILANFRDMGDHRAIVKDEVLAFIESTKRPDGSSEVMYAESSMKNAFGLMHLHKFLSIPFLQLQQDMLLQQIQVSREQMLAARDELTAASTTGDQNYDMFTAHLQHSAEERRKNQQQRSQEAQEETSSSVRSPSISSHHSETPPTSHVAERRDSGSGKRGSKVNRFTKMLNRGKKAEPIKDPVPPAPSQDASRGRENIEDFVPEGDVDAFLDDTEEGEEEEGVDGEDSEEESSEEDANPVVAQDEDLSSEEDGSPTSPPKPLSPDTPTSPLTPVSPEPSPVVKRDKPVRPPVQLKSAKEIELTESEGEVDDEEEEEQTVPKSSTDRQKDIELFWGKKGGDEKPKVKAKSGALLLNWTVPEPSKPPKKKKESPDLSEERKAKRKKKSSKGSHRKRDGEKEAAATNGASSAAAVNDPFGVNALDAWLNSEDILQPTMFTRGGGAEVGQEVGGDSEGSPHQRRSKKHRDKGTSDSTHRKKHKSRRSAKEDHTL